MQIARMSQLYELACLETSIIGLATNDDMYDSNPFFNLNRCRNIAEISWHSVILCSKRPQIHLEHMLDDFAHALN